VRAWVQGWMEGLRLWVEGGVEGEGVPQLKQDTLQLPCMWALAVVGTHTHRIASG